MTSVGIFAKTFTGTSPRAALVQARDAGYDTVQYNMSCSGLASLPMNVSAADVEALRSAVAETGVRLVALSATYNMVHPDAAHRAAGQRSLTVLAETAAALRIPLLTLCTGSRNAADQWAAHPDNASREAWHDLLASMQAAIAVAEEHDLMLGVEPESANVVGSATRARQLIDELGSDHVGIVMDAANLIEPVLRETAADRSDTITRAVELLAERIVLVHAKDRDVDGAVVGPGRGIVDFNAYFRTLALAGVHAPVVAHGLDARDAERAAAFLRACMVIGGYAPGR